METNTTLEILKKHEVLADLVMNHGYVPQGSAGSIFELSQLHKTEGLGHVDAYCGSCVFRMFETLYKRLLPTLVINTIEQTEPIPLKEVKQTFPKHNKKKK